MFHTETISKPDDVTPELRDFFYKNTPAFFQSPDFLRLLHGIQGYEPFIIILKDNDGIAATLTGSRIKEGKGLKAHISQRTVIYGHPVISKSVADDFAHNKLLTELNRISNGSLFTQFRNDSDQETTKAWFKQAGYHWHDRLNLLKPLVNIEEAWMSMSSSRKRQINASRNNKLEVHESPTGDQLNEFYEILFKLYKNRVRKPLPPFAFFERFHALSQTGNFNGRILVCTSDGKVVSGILCPFTPGGSIYEWYVCGLDEEYRQLKIYPSVMVTWAAMDLGSRLGCRTFDFMGLGIPTRKYGVRDFKTRFGGEWVNHGRWSRVNNPVLYPLAELGYNVLRVLREV